MATYELSGAGVVGLSDSVTRLFVEVTIYPPGISTGLAIPTNYFHIGLLRLGVQGAYGHVIPIDASTMFIDLPSGVTSLGYSLQGSGMIRVSEDVATPPSPTNSFFGMAVVPDATNVISTSATYWQEIYCGYPPVSITHIFVWRPAADTMLASADIAYFMSDGTTAWSASGVSLAFGWNDIPITPVLLPEFSNAGGPAIFVPSGAVIGWQDDIWNDPLQVTPLSAAASHSHPSSSLEYGTDDYYQTWFGLDVGFST